MSEKFFTSLQSYLESVPGVEGPIAKGEYSDGLWWVKFRIDIHHALAWYVVQEIGHVVNYLSLEERLPATFYPISPPPYLNGGPSEFLSWIIEAKDKSFTPATLKSWLEGRLPQPVSDETEWTIEEED